LVASNLGRYKASYLRYFHHLSLFVPTAVKIGLLMVGPYYTQSLLFTL
jgi:hypothetical protein